MQCLDGVNAFLRKHPTRYRTVRLELCDSGSQTVNRRHRNNRLIRMLSELATNDPQAFAALVEVAKKALPADTSAPKAA